jgi:CheY-like chemotaxis protein
MPQTILIAVTDPNIVYLLQRYAEESGFQSVHSDREPELLPLARQIQPDLIVLQTEPLEVPWQQTLRRLKSDPVIGHTPVIVYSCLDESSPIEGVAGFLQKSILYNDFVLALEQAGLQIDRTDHKGIFDES